MTLAMCSRMAASAAIGSRAWIAPMMRSCCGRETAGHPGRSDSANWCRTSWPEFVLCDGLPHLAGQLVQLA